MKIIIGVVGQNGSGKDSFFHFLGTLLGSKTMSQIRSSDVLADSLKIWDIASSRQNLQNLAKGMNDTFGPGTLTRAVLAKVKKSEADVVVFGGVRWPPDVEMIRSFPKNLLVYVTADPQVRYDRIKQRREKVGEGNLSWEQFLKEENAETELKIPEIAKQADVKIDNNGTLEDLAEKVRDFYSKYLQNT